ncbi:MAG: pyridoxal-phosphate dependent enzyme, partial [Myxococcota bacterium]
LRIEGQKTVAFEISQALGWSVPDWVAIPGGNLGNVTALVKGFRMLCDAGLTDRMPRVLCAQAESANPLFRSFENGFAPLQPMTAEPTQATAIRIGNPVSFEKAVAALEATDGVVDSVTEEALAETARIADESGLYVCPHTAVALAATRRQRDTGLIPAGASVVVVATAHGLKFTEFKSAVVGDRVAGASSGAVRAPIDVADDFAAVRAAALEGA